MNATLSDRRWGGATAAEHRLPKPSTAVITYNDLMPIEFIHT